MATNTVVAVISDIHGNKHALKAVLDDSIKEGATHYIFLGDYVFDMPFSNEVVNLIKGVNNAVTIAGNKEIQLKSLLKNSPETYSQKMGVVYKTVETLSDSAKSFILSLNCQASLLIDSTTYYACHQHDQLKQQDAFDFYRESLFQQHSHDDYLNTFKANISEPSCRQALKEINCDVVLFGHNHLQGYGLVDNCLVVNPGSCGQPLDFDPRASYTIIKNHKEVIERRVEYDIKQAVKEAKNTVIANSGLIWSNVCFLTLESGRDYLDHLLVSYHDLLSTNDSIDSDEHYWLMAYQRLLNELG